MNVRFAALTAILVIAACGGPAAGATGVAVSAAPSHRAALVNIVVEPASLTPDGDLLVVAELTDPNGLLTIAQEDAGVIVAAWSIVNYDGQADAYDHCAEQGFRDSGQVCLDASMYGASRLGEQVSVFRTIRDRHRDCRRDRLPLRPSRGPGLAVEASRHKRIRRQHFRHRRWQQQALVRRPTRRHIDHRLRLQGHRQLTNTPRQDRSPESFSGLLFTRLLASTGIEAPCYDLPRCTALQAAPPSRWNPVSKGRGPRMTQPLTQNLGSTRAI